MPRDFEFSEVRDLTPASEPDIKTEFRDASEVIEQALGISNPSEKDRALIEEAIKIARSMIHHTENREGGESTGFKDQGMSADQAGILEGQKQTLKYLEQQLGKIK